MAYMREGFIIVRAKGRELIIDEFDEDGVEIEASEDKTNRRMTTRGKNVYSILPNVPYELTISIKPDSKTISRVEDFMRFLKANKYPELEIETHEILDTQSITTYYTDGNVLSEVDSEGAFVAGVPVTTLKLAGTREEKKIG